MSAARVVPVATSPAPPLAASRGNAEEVGRMPFLAHLGELRRRIIWSAVAWAAGVVVCFEFAPHIFTFLRRPLEGLGAQKMIVLGPMEMFFTYIKLAVAGGLLLASPFILLQLWLFIAPGLYPSERRWVVPFVASGTGFFVGGAAFCFFVVLPLTFRFLADMVPLQVEAHYSVALYFSLVVQLVLAFGIVFELPLVMTVVGAAGIVSSAQLARFRRYWLVLAFVIGGVLTPTPDPFTQATMAVPLVLFFELGIAGVRLVERRQGRGLPRKPA